jgi:hypothetical protein
MVSLLPPFILAISRDLDELNTLQKTGVAEFSSLWLVYSPGEKMGSNDNGVEQISVLGSFDLIQPMKQDPYRALRLDYWDWNGLESGYQCTHFAIETYAGTKPVTELKVFPLEWAWDSKRIKDGAIRRGKTV